VLATRDGGAHWSARNVDLNNMYQTPTGVAFSGTATGWIVGRDALLLGTIDGGATWAKRRPGALQFTYFTDVTCTGSNRFVAVGADGYTGVGMIAGTMPDGTWGVLSYGPFVGLNAVSFSGSSRGWAVGGLGTIVRTSTGGAAWAAQRSGTTEALYGVDFVDATNGWAVGRSGTILVTHDGGGTWKAQKSGVTTHLSDVDFVDARHGWVAQSDGTILATSNGGATWRRQHSAAWWDITAWPAISFVDARHGWMAGGGGGILAYDPSPPVATSKATKLRGRRTGSIVVKVTNPSGGADQVSVTIAVYKAGKLKKRLRTGWRAGNSTVTVRYRPTLPAGSYTMKLTAVDRFGNQRDKPTTARLTIR